MNLSPALSKGGDPVGRGNGKGREEKGGPSRSEGSGYFKKQGTREELEKGPCGATATPQSKSGKERGVLFKVLN